MSDADSFSAATAPGTLPPSGAISPVCSCTENSGPPPWPTSIGTVVDLLVAQNGAETKLFRNVGATPGLRVRLVGADRNPRAIGATVRLRYEKGERGPAVSATAGSGYWSQHSLTPVWGRGNRTVEAVEVQWPDGRESEHPVPKDARSVVVRK